MALLCTPLPDDTFTNTLPIIASGTFGRCPPQDFVITDVSTNPNKVSLGWTSPDLSLDQLTMGEPAGDGGVFARVGEAPERVIAHKRELLGFILHRGTPGFSPSGKQIGEDNVLVDQDTLDEAATSFDDFLVAAGQNLAYRLAAVIDSGFFNPASDLPSLATWLDAQDSNTVQVFGGSDVDNWVSKDALQRIFSQGVPANKPQSGVTINGRAALDMVGTRWLTSSFAFSGTTGSIFMVLEPTALVAADALMGITGVVPATDHIQLRVGTGLEPAFLRTASGLASPSFEGSTPLATVPVVLEWHTDGTSYEVRINGVVETLNFLLGANNGLWFASVAGLLDTTLGALDPTGASPASAKYGEVIVVDGAILSDELKRVTRKYLGTRWEIAVV